AQKAAASPGLRFGTKDFLHKVSWTFLGYTFPLIGNQRSCESEVLRSNGRSEGPCSNALWRAASEVEDQPALVLSKRPYLLLNARAAAPSIRQRRINVGNEHDYRQRSKWRAMD